MFGMDPKRLREAVLSIYEQAMDAAAKMPHKRDAKPCSSPGCFGFEFVRGKCYNCYHAEYSRQRRAKKKAEREDS